MCKTINFLIICLITQLTTLWASDKPNFVWILSEDNSSHYYAMYQKGGAVTPNIEALAKEGLFFENAFSCAPVCSVARTTLISSCYSPRIGTQYHRRSEFAPMPDNLDFFPAYLKRAGYYTTNSSKMDYNIKLKKGIVWNKATNGHWKNRKNGQPFFAKFTYGKSHESSLFGSMDNPKHDAKSTNVWPYFPNTELFRNTHASYHDRMMLNDAFVKKIVDQLKADGLLESTFVFYFSDHGGVMARSKGYIYETGLQVPLVVRIPENFKHLVAAKRGDKIKGFVEFVDLGPTLLHLAGVDIPKGFDGKPVLGNETLMKEAAKRDEAFGYADRFDEKYELCRSLRKGNFKYKRNYEAYWPDGLMNNYRYKNQSWQEWLSLHKAGKLNDVQKQFFQVKPVEQLFDISKDPHEINNLSNDPKYKEVLLSLRKRLQERLKGMPDLSFYPEHIVTSDKVLKNPVAFGQSKKGEIAGLIDTADLALLPSSEAKDKIVAALKSDNPWIRYWAVTAASNFGTKAKDIVPQVKAILKDSEIINQVRAAEFLAINGIAPQEAIRKALNQSKSYTETVNILNTVVYLRDFKGYSFDFNKNDVKVDGKWVEHRMKYLGWE